MCAFKKERHASRQAKQKAGHVAAVHAKQALTDQASFPRSRVGKNALKKRLYLPVGACIDVRSCESFDEAVNRNRDACERFVPAAIMTDEIMTAQCYKAGR
jgi:hypothetical protein